MKLNQKLTYRGYEIEFKTNPLSYSYKPCFFMSHPDGEGDYDTAESLQEAKELIDTGLIDIGNMYLRGSLEYDYETERFFISND